MKIKVSFLILLVLFVSVYLYFKKVYVEYDLICHISKYQKFSPDAYVLIHSKSDFKNFIEINNRTKDIGELCIDKIDDSHSYVIVYGREVESMSYSLKTTHFNDKSSDYAKYDGRKVLFIKYKRDSLKGIFVYKIDKDRSLRGFYGI